MSGFPPAPKTQKRLKYYFRDNKCEEEGEGFFFDALRVESGLSQHFHNHSFVWSGSFILKDQQNKCDFSFLQHARKFTVVCSSQHACGGVVKTQI